MKVLFFASIAEIAGTNEADISGISSVSALKNHFENEYPRIKNLKYAVAVNSKIVHGERNLNDNDEIAFLPPFSGG